MLAKIDLQLASLWDMAVRMVKCYNERLVLAINQGITGKSNCCCFFFLLVYSFAVSLCS